MDIKEITTGDSEVYGTVGTEVGASVGASAEVGRWPANFPVTPYVLAATRCITLYK